MYPSSQREKEFHVSKYCVLWCSRALRQSQKVLLSSPCALWHFPGFLMAKRETYYWFGSNGCEWKCHFQLVAVKAEKAMAPHSSTLAWKIPWMEEPGRLQSMGLLGVGHNWATSLPLFILMHWRKKWQRTPVFLPGESQGQGSLVGCYLWGHTESDTTEAT